MGETVLSFFLYTLSICYKNGELTGMETNWVIPALVYKNAYENITTAAQDFVCFH